MKYFSDNERQRAFDALMGELSESACMNESDYDNAAEEFALIFLNDESDPNGFSQVYSNVMREALREDGIRQFDPTYTNSSLELLVNNLDILSRNKVVVEDEHLYQIVCDLTDKFNLELVHTAFTTRIINQQDQRLKTTRRSLQMLVDKSNKTVNEVEQQVKDAKGRIEEVKEKSQRDSIAILGIFAAVVIFANGGIVFSSSAIQAMAGQNVVYLAFIIAVVGICVFDMLFALFTFIYRMVRQDGDNWHILSKNTFKLMNIGLFSIAFVLGLASLLVYLNSVGLIVPSS